MKIPAGIAAFLFAVLFACQSQAQPPNRPGGDRERGNGQARGGEQRRQRGGMGDRDPAEMVGRLIEQFDKDGDEKLDSTELTALLTMMRERRGGRGGEQGMEGQGARRGGRAMGREGGRDAMARDGEQRGARNREMMQKKRRNSGNEDATPGGDVPKRPAAE
ncbi:hypothetical protein [Rhodopirellula sallentina]|uniref:Secreted protein n=1 Tax=Rhodopirellula sallentina SM41 TaxID=1263870 RepID=M5U7N1_9BACT|nr:hypothetical protein [Rhodopirellula sallentina]EMI51963.1 secreted protein [Rhodopirellula sallentina SM41]